MVKNVWDFLWDIGVIVVRELTLAEQNEHRARVVLAYRQQLERAQRKHEANLLAAAQGDLLALEELKFSAESIQAADCELNQVIERLYY